jgi:group II intron reverse transcriptase/maturase
MPVTANHTVEKTKVQQLQNKLYRAAKSSRSRRFHALYDKVWRSDILDRAWFEVAKNGGAPGVDGVSIESIEEAGVSQFLDHLADSLRNGTYRPKPVRRVRIPKPDGGERLLGVPCLADRCVQAAAKLVLEPIFEADFASCSYGFRPNRSAHHALDAIRVAVKEGRSWIAEADIRTFFDSVDKARLLAMVAERVSDRRMLALLRSWLDSGVLDGGELLDPETGTPQGGVASPLLANIYLTALDRAFEKLGSRFRMIRYADDFVVCAPTEADAHAALALAAEVLSDLGLELHPDKTRVVGLNDGQGFDFLGFHHQVVASTRWPGRRYLQTWPSAKAMKRARARIRQITAKRMQFMGLEATVEALNRFLRGWGAYFRHGNSGHKFGQLDAYVHLRLAHYEMMRHGRRGWGWTTHYRLPWLRATGVHRLSGTVRWGPTHATGEGRR